jgi:hypothetical protein
MERLEKAVFRCFVIDFYRQKIVSYNRQRRLKMRKMKTTLLAIPAVLFMFACQVSANWIGNNSVNVVPSQPTNTDLITFNISGWAVGATSWADHDVFSQTGTSLQLDLYIDAGMGGVGSYWGSSKQIQPLISGTYNLEVRAFDWQFGSPEYGTVQDTYNSSFTVTPEPASAFLLLLGAGLFGLNRKKC